MIWLARCRHSRGFGVQSPSAYSFVRYVINEHYPYYAYFDLKKKFPKLTHTERKLNSLYFRIANFAQASFWTVASTSCRNAADYIQAGCRKSEIVNMLPSGFTKTVILIDFSSSDVVTFLMSLPYDKLSDSILIAENIHSGKREYALWRHMVLDKRVITSYDLYYCGILMFDREKYKQNYVINF